MADNEVRGEWLRERAERVKPPIAKAIMILEPWAVQEQRVWRHVNTFGGYVWPPSPSETEAAEREAEGPMTVTEMLDEIEWLTANGTSVELALQMVPGRTAWALAKAAKRAGRHMLASRIERVASTGRTWAGGAEKQRRRTA